MTGLVDTELMGATDRLVLSERANRLRDEYFNCTPGVAAERVGLATSSWRETEGEPLTIRRAKLVKRVLEGVPTPIFRDQLLVGSETKYFRGAYPQIDYDGSFFISLVDEQTGKVTLGGPEVKGIVTEEDMLILKEAVGFWKGQTAAEKVRDALRRSMGQWYEDFTAAGNHDPSGWFAWPTGLAWEVLLKKGLRSFIQEAEANIQNWQQGLDDDVEKLYFWQAAIIECEAAINYAKRYAQTAREAAMKEEDLEWRQQLCEIAEICDWVPEHPARSFREALQCLVLVFLATKLEIPISAPGSWGLVDQFLYPYFKQDLVKGLLSLEQALDLLADFMLFNNRLELVTELSWREQQQKGFLVSVTLGGQNIDGEEVSNEFSYLVLHVMGLVKLAEPHMVIRWNKKTPDWLMRKAIETNCLVGGGVPQFQNSDHIVNYMQSLGISLENAVNWIGQGCSQSIPADQGGYPVASYINVPLCLDLTLHNGIAPKTGKRLGLETGDPRSFTTFEDFYAAFKKQTEYITRKQLRRDRIADKAKAANFRQTFASVLIKGCMEKGAEYMMGGLPHYRLTLKKDRGHVPAADALFAVKKLVYDDKKISMVELLDALDSDFAGEKGEDIRQLCLGVPKFGNDIDEVDFMLEDVAKYTGDIIRSEKNIWGYPLAVNRNGQGWHMMAGKKLGALPNGRKAGETLPDGALSPMQGMDRNGPTAALNSVLKANFAQSATGAVLNLKFPASLLKTQEVRDKVVALTNGFLASGGTYIQYNILDTSVLREAQKNPEKYRDLVVRVGGYSAYFVELSAEIQEDIISRTEHGVVSA